MQHPKSRKRPIKIINVIGVIRVIMIIRVGLFGLLGLLELLGDILRVGAKSRKRPICE